MTSPSVQFQGLNRFTGRMKRMSRKKDQAVRQSLGQFGVHGEEVIRGLAPRDSGELEESINHRGVRKTATDYVTSVGTNKEYALKVHEYPVATYGYRHKYEKGVRYDNYYINGRGRRTLKKAKVEGFRPGRKYFTNGMTVLEDDWRKTHKDLLSQIIGGKR